MYDVGYQVQIEVQMLIQMILCFYLHAFNQLIFCVCDEKLYEMLSVGAYRALVCQPLAHKLTLDILSLHASLPRYRIVISFRGVVRSM